MQAYQLAIDLNTDYIEPDLCLSKDGIFVAMHSILLDETTNVAELPQYSDRYTTKQVNGANQTGYFVSDFLYSELQDLRLNQRLSIRTDLFDGYFKIPSFTEIMSLVWSQYNSSGIIRGMYPELKEPAYHESLGFDMVDMFLSELVSGGFVIDGADNDIINQVVPVVIQCFDADTLKQLRSKTDIPLIYLLDIPVAPFWNAEFLEEVSTFADGISPEKTFLGQLPFPLGKQSVELAHETGLAVVPWTFRADTDILPKFEGSFAAEEMYYYACLGIDAAFTEFPDQTRETIDMYLNVSSSVESYPFCV